MRSPAIAVLFLHFSAGFAFFAVGTNPIIAAMLVWLATSLALVALAYAGFPRFAFAKDPRTGRIPATRKALLLPYLAMTWGLWHLLRAVGREAACVPLSPGLTIGRRLLRSEYPSDVATIVDLTWEFERVVPTKEGVRYELIPILDAASLSPRELAEVAARIASLPRPLYVHCAQGHGRTAMVAAAVLLSVGIAESGEDALWQVRAARPGARPNRRQRESLLAVVTSR
jgi:protein-tyrosine phosphatase